MSFKNKENSNCDLFLGGRGRNYVSGFGEYSNDFNEEQFDLENNNNNNNNNGMNGIFNENRNINQNSFGINNINNNQQESIGNINGYDKNTAYSCGNTYRRNDCEYKNNQFNDINTIQETRYNDNNHNNNNNNNNNINIIDHEKRLKKLEKQVVRNTKILSQNIQKLANQQALIEKNSKKINENKDRLQAHTISQSFDHLLKNISIEYKTGNPFDVYFTENKKSNIRSTLANLGLSGILFLSPKYQPKINSLCDRGYKLTTNYKNEFRIIDCHFYPKCQHTLHQDIHNPNYDQSNFQSRVIPKICPGGPNSKLTGKLVFIYQGGKDGRYICCGKKYSGEPNYTDPNRDNDEKWHLIMAMIITFPKIFQQAVEEKILSQKKKTSNSKSSKSKSQQQQQQQRKHKQSGGGRRQQQQQQSGGRGGRRVEPPAFPVSGPVAFGAPGFGGRGGGGLAQQTQQQQRQQRRVQQAPTQQARTQQARTQQQQKQQQARRAGRRSSGGSGYGYGNGTGHGHGGGQKRGGGQQRGGGFGGGQPKGRGRERSGFVGQKQPQRRSNNNQYVNNMNNEYVPSWDRDRDRSRDRSSRDSNGNAFHTRRYR